jgi:hypothetical protein
VTRGKVEEGAEGWIDLLALRELSAGFVDVVVGQKLRSVSEEGFGHGLRVGTRLARRGERDSKRSQTASH